MTKPSVICCLVLLAFLSGCASAPKERVAIKPEREAGSQSKTILSDAIDRKIERLETLLKEKLIRSEDEPLALVIIGAYQSAKSCLRDPLQASCRDVNQELLQGMSLIDERYFALSRNTTLLGSVERPAPGASLDPNQAETRPQAVTTGLVSMEPETRVEGPGQAPPIPPETRQATEAATKAGRVEDSVGTLQGLRESIREEAHPGTDTPTTEPIEKGDGQQLQEHIELMAMKERGLSHARQLVEAEKFEEAIAAIDSLGVEESLNEASKALLDEAVSGIVNRERNRAAKAFYSARQTDDPAKKEAYLRTSHEILKQIIDKYPSSSLISKIKSNLDTVKLEMAKAGVKP